MPASSIKDTAFSAEHLKTCKGYDPKFINVSVNISASVLSEAQKKLLPVVDGNDKKILNYSNFSVWYNTKRKVPFCSMSNIDGSKKNENAKRANGFNVDPRVDAKFQLNNEFYDLEKNFTEFEIGHMASNDEMSWGADNDAAQLSAYESFHFPNSVPQAERLNSGLWRSLEQYIIKEGGSAVNKRITVFTGPVLNKKDPKYKNDQSFQVPLLFWKIIVFEWKGQMWSTGFVMSHEKRLKELGILIYPPAIEREVAEPGVFNDYKYKKVFQVNVSMVEKLTGLKFKWTKVKRVTIADDKNQLESIIDTTSAGDIEKMVRRKSTIKKVKLNMVLPKK